MLATKIQWGVPAAQWRREKKYSSQDGRYEISHPMNKKLIRLAQSTVWHKQ